MLSKNIQHQLITLILVACTILYSHSGQSTESPFNSYLQALAATTHGESSTEDVERLLDFYADDIVYEHPAVGIRLEGKQAQRQGLTAFLDSYAGSAGDSQVEVIDYLKGPKAIAMRLNVSFMQQRGDSVEQVSREQLRIIEVKENKISRIIDYW